MMSKTVTTELLAARAAYTLRGNDLGELTTAAPRLYPHLWSWDAAFISIGLATISVPRAIAELRTLLRAQWRTGMLPHIVFGPEADYYPGPEVWQAQRAGAAPEGIRTSGICQPPVHAIAVARILEAGRRNGGRDRDAAEQFAADSFDQWLAWHRWLGTARDPDRRGLIEIYHSWESGMDNSPRWDPAYANVSVAPSVQPAAQRRDTSHVTDSRQRPTDTEYRRYLWLVEQLRAAGYDDELVRQRLDFRVADVFMSAIAAAASEELAQVGSELGRTDEAAELLDLAARFRAGVLSTVSTDTGLARDQDVRTGAWLDAPTIAGFAPLVCGAPSGVTDRLVDLLAGPAWCGHPRLRYALPTSTAIDWPGVQPRAYWRGPQWPVMNWLLWWSLQRHGRGTALREQIRAEALRQLGDLSFGEYYEPFTGESLGSREQSWSAAVTLDWLLRPTL